MTYTLADAISRAQEADRTRLYCVSCYRRKPRLDFRETPWHGRAASCTRCEAFRYVDHLYEQQRWELEQERTKVRMLIRHVQRLRLQRIMTPLVRSADALTELEQPYMDAVERAHRRFLAAYMTLPVPEFERRRKRQRLMKENR